MFLKRSYKSEMMDDFSIQDERIDAALSELKITNKFLGGVSTTAEGLNLLLKAIPGTVARNPADEITILDIGAGASDNLFSLRNKFPSVKITSFDLNKRACRFLTTKPVGLGRPPRSDGWSILKRNSAANVICADALKIPVKEKQFDIVHSSLFLHHFKEDEIKKMITDFLKISKTGIIINDLRRSVLALCGIKIISLLFSKSELFINDAPLSVKRGFVKSELTKVLDDAGIKNFKIRKKWAFRWLLVIYAE